MAEDKRTRQWVSDELMSLMGYSEPVVVKYVIGTTKKASSSTEVYNKLVDYGLSASAATDAFAKQIFARVPHNNSLSNYEKEEKNAAQLARQQKRYRLIDADDEDDEPTVVKHAKSDTQKKYFRKKTGVEESEDDEIEEKNIRHVQKRTKKYQDDDIEDEFESEEARARDQEEREQLERNIKERDAAGTRKLTEPKLSKKDEEEMIRRSKALEQNDITNLRKVSRQEYVKKRRDKKLEELKDDILDEEFLFQNVKLTEAEKQEISFKKKIYELAKDHLDDSDIVNEYRMPDAYDHEGGVNQEKRFATLMQRYRDPNATGEKMNPFAEQEAWEEHQIGKASLSFGSKNKKQDSQDFQYIFEDGVEFIKKSVMDGEMYENELDTEEADAIAKSELQKLQDDRKTLPVYPYREQLLEAINNHQVC
ncbi:hypothetical protein ZOSMA_35G00850 [Zostera marina]|uniref:Uncharacterized protein n=1 Tax=Zostera marina TaxID=29655 RepID=A0A0K9P6K1_ZOSMR|nr:hypothetical protein ZOSMA_35G00850 [Zostera marina]